MNLATIADLIGKRSGLVGANDVLAAKAFLTMRHDQLYRSFLWKDSLITYVVPIQVDPSAYLLTDPYMPSKGQLLMPTDMQQVVAVRTSEDYLNVERPMVYYRISQDQFSNTGAPVEFYGLPRCVWETDVECSWFLRSQPEDDGKSVIFEYTGSQAEYYGGLAKVDTADFNSTQDHGFSGKCSKINYITPSATLLGSASLLVAPGDTIDPTGAIGPVSQLNGLDKGGAQFPQREQIRFVQIPNKATTIRVLGKRTPPRFTADTDVPGIHGLDAIVFALAYYDICLRDERSAEEAMASAAEAVGPQYLSSGIAGGFLKKLIEEEVEQGAYNTRIMPESGFGGDEYFFGPYPSKSQPY